MGNQIPLADDNGLLARSILAIGFKTNSVLNLSDMKETDLCAAQSFKVFNI